MENVQLREKQYRYRVIPIKTTTIGKGNCFYQQNTRPLGIHNLTPFLKITLMQTIDKRAATKRCRRKITEGQWAVLNFV